MANAERIMVDYLNASRLGIPARMEVPARRPKEFITVERTGGAETRFRSSATLAIQAWSTSRYKASALAERLRVILAGMPRLPQVSACDVTAIYNFEEADPPRQPRYQLTVELTVKNQ